MTEPTSIGEVRGIAGIGPGDVIADKYRIDEVLGVGGMGVVFLARHTTLGGPVALKFLSRDFVGNAEALSRFRREAQAAARLRSEHVVRVFDIGVHASGSPYIVMEHLEGSDLQRLLRSEGRLSVELAVDLVLQACSALAEAHREGIVHRDLKPSNLFCVPRANGGFTLKIVDFGISKLASAEQSVTVTNSFIGSPAYMSPEQMDAPHRVDERADIWSLGVVLYECVTGKLPFAAGSYPEICLAVVQKSPLEPRAHRSELPLALERVILKCLEKDRAARFASVAELARALAEFARPATALPGANVGTTSAATAVSVSNPPRADAPRLPSFSRTQPSWVRSERPASARRSSLRLAAVAGAALALAVLTAVSLKGRSPAGDTGSQGESSARPSSASVPVPASEAVRVAAPARPVLVIPVPEPTASVRAVESALKPAPSATARPAHRMRAAAGKPPAERDAKSPTWTR